MKTKYIVITILVLIIYVIVSSYIGSRIASSFSDWLNPASRAVFWALFSFLSSSYVLGRISNIFFPGDWGDRLIWVGAYWLGASFYLWWLWVAVDGVVWLSRTMGWMPAHAVAATPQTAFGVLAATAVLLVYGTWRARTPQVKCYDIVINKPCLLNKLTIVMVSDLHLGLLVGRRRLEKLVISIEQLQPDLVLLPGDILDENVGAFLDNHMPAVLRRIKAPLGVFGCLGSHEYIWGHAGKAMEALARAGVTVLRDEQVVVADSVVLVGRDDRYKEKLTGIARKCLRDIISNCDTNQPVIMMDHQPVDLAAGQLCGVDLYLAGHTHNGQIFPINLLTKVLFKIDWGYRRVGKFQMIVSSGFGTWGPPIRIGSKPEIVKIEVNFSKE